MKRYGYACLLLALLPMSVLAGGTCVELTWGQKTLLDFMSLMGIAKIGATVLGIACFGYLLRGWIKALIELFAEIPIEVYEAIAYVLSAVLLIAGMFVSETNALWFGLSGCLLVPVALKISASLRKLEANELKFFGTLFLAWTPAALLYGSSVLGFLSIAALMGLVGFSVWIMPLCYVVGFKDESALGKATATAFSVLTLFVALRMLGLESWPIPVFQNGAFWLGSFVGFIGLLIASSRWYDDRDRAIPCALANALMLAAGLAAIVIGTMWDIGPLRGVGGTFLVLWFLEKPFEFKYQNAKAYAYVGLLVAFEIGLGIYWAENHMAMIAPYLLF